MNKMNSDNLPELSPEEHKKVVDLAVHEARVKKATRLAKEAYWRDVEELSKPYEFSSTEDYGKSILAYIRRELCKNFVIDEHNQEVWNKLLLYFAKDPAFEKLGKGYSLEKGIFLSGTTGTGKTILMKAFSRNLGRYYSVKGARVLVSRWIENKQNKWTDVVQLHSVAKETKDLSIKEKWNSPLTGICIDDLGTEEKQQHYGNPCNVVGEILLNRYDNNVANYLTHVTSNLNSKSFEEYYGQRLTSRIHQMFNFIHFDSELDRRKVIINQ